MWLDWGQLHILKTFNIFCYFWGELAANVINRFIHFWSLCIHSNYMDRYRKIIERIINQRRIFSIGLRKENIFLRRNNIGITLNTWSRSISTIVSTSTSSLLRSIPKTTLTILIISSIIHLHERYDNYN